MCCFAVYHDVPLPHGLPSSIQQQGDVIMKRVFRSFLVIWVKRPVIVAFLIGRKRTVNFRNQRL